MLDFNEPITVMTAKHIVIIIVNRMTFGILKSMSKNPASILITEQPREGEIRILVKF